MAEKRPAPKKKPQKPKESASWGRIIGGFCLVIVVLATGIGCGFLTASYNTKPDIREINPASSSHLYDIEGQELASIHAEENRVPVKLAQMPTALRDAFVCIEDRRYDEHLGIDPWGILRAFVANITGGEVTEGGSTITQQLAKNAYLNSERTIKRKVQEMFLALQLERKYTKSEILEMYLNQIYFGQGAYGVEAAAQTYFGKHVSELELNECAMLAGIPKSPNYYSPFNRTEKEWPAKDRMNTVLDAMANFGRPAKGRTYTKSQIAAAKEAEIKLKKSGSKEGEASYFIDYVLQTLMNDPKIGEDAVYKEGLKIYTTIDMKMQRAAEAAMKNLPLYSKTEDGIQQPQGALVAIDPHNGQIKAMVGGRGTDQFNRATMAVRQPGSAFKPFVFAAALIKGFTPDTVIEDAPIKIGEWEPQNYNRNFNGKIPLRTVAINSLNVPTVRIAQFIGMPSIISLAEDMGITTFVKEGRINDMNFASSLGGLTRGVTPLELTSAYGTFANQGVHVKPTAIVKVCDKSGNVIYQNDMQIKTAMEKEIATEMTDMLQGVVLAGTGTGANIGRPAAGKTGTTSDYLDAWFVGYTPDLVAGVWIGCDNNDDLGGMTGGTLPASIWNIFMSAAVADMPAKNFSGARRFVVKPVKELLDDKKKEEEKDKLPDGKTPLDKKTPAKERTGKPSVTNDSTPVNSERQKETSRPAVSHTTPSNNKEDEASRARRREKESQKTQPVAPKPAAKNPPSPTPSPSPTAPGLTGGKGKN